MAISEAKLEKIRHLTRKNPTLQKVFLTMLENDEATLDTVKETYELYQTYKNLLNNHQVNISDYANKTFEDLFDDISQLAQENEKRKYALSFVSKKYAHLLDEKSYDLFHLIKEMNLPHEKVNDLVVKKIAKYRTPEQFNEALNDFVESAQNANINTIKEKINDSNLNVNIVKEDHNQNILLAEIKDYPASKALGSKSWCISTNKSYFNNYTRNGQDFPNKQYFLWDFNRSVSDTQSFVAFTMSADKRITASHKKDDRAISSSNMNDILKKFNIDVTPYPKEEIMEMVQTSKKMPIKRTLGYVLTYMDEPKDKKYLKQMLASNNIGRNEWDRAGRNIKSPKLFFEALEETYQEKRRGTKAFKNIDDAINALVLNDCSRPTNSPKVNLPIDLKLFWSRDSVESFLNEKVETAKKIRSINEVNSKKEPEYVNRFNVDLLEFYKTFKKNDDDYITVSEKQEATKQIFKRYQHNINKEVAERFYNWSSEIFASQGVVSALASACVDDVKTFNEIAQATQIDNELTYNAFKTEDIGCKVVKKLNNIDHLTETQKQAVSEIENIPLKNYDEFKYLRDEDIVSTKALINSFNKVLKTALEDDIDFEEFKEMVNCTKEHQGNTHVWKMAQTKAIAAHDSDFSKSDYILSQDNDHRTAINFLKASVPKRKPQMLDTIVKNMEDSKEAGALLNELLVKSSGADTGVNKKELIHKIFEKFSPNDEITPASNQTKLSKYESTLVNIMDRNKETAMITTVMDHLEADKRKDLLLKTKKAKDPVVAFLLNSEEPNDDPKPEPKASSRKGYKAV